MAAPIGNTNAVKHGRRARRERLSVGSLSPKLRRVEHDSRLFRARLEQAVETKYGRIDMARAAVINEATYQHRHIALCNRWLRVEENLPVDQELTLSREILSAAKARNRLIDALGLGAAAASSIWSTIGTPGEAATSPADSEPDAAEIATSAWEALNEPNASDATPGAPEATQEPMP